MNFQIGQRYFNPACAELGPGIVTQVDDRTITLNFAKAELEQTYAKKGSPLKRLQLRAGDTFRTREDLEFEILEVESRDGILFYLSNSGQWFNESELGEHIELLGPLDQAYLGKLGDQFHFKLRTETLRNQMWYEQLKVQGLIGPRIDLLGHQLYCADRVCSQKKVRSILGHEVGLGKTIMAGLIINRLLVTGRMKRAVIIVPDGLIHQWFFELYQKFKLTFSIVNEETYLDEGQNPFDESNLVICGLRFLNNYQKAQDLLAQASFDLAVVDEAHEWAKNIEHVELGYIKALTSKVEHLLMLTATPDQFGLEAKFSLLQLLDPLRYQDLEEFKNKSTDLEVISKILEKKLEGLNSEEKKFIETLNFPDNFRADQMIHFLIDLHGIGRAFYQLNRQHLRDVFRPKRKRELYLLEEKNSIFVTKAQWLLEFLKNKQKEKILLIGTYKDELDELDQFLHANFPSIKLAKFNSSQKAMERDRQAAYFQEENGAHLMLCTEEGAAGRNFQFAHHLLLWDIPENPEKLEQRIGRLDRIGQKKDVAVSVPVIAQTKEHLNYLIQDRVFNGFIEHIGHGGKFYQSHLEELQSFFAIEHQTSEQSEFLKTWRQSFLDYSREIETKVDPVVAANSIHWDKANELKNAIESVDDSLNLQAYLELVFEVFGVELEEMGGEIFLARPSHTMLIPSFPGLSGEGLRFSFDRNLTLDRPDVDFMSWEHPLTQGIMNLILSEEFGNFQIAKRVKRTNPKIYCEFYFKWMGQGIHPFYSHFAPMNQFRVLLDKEGLDLSEKFTEEFLGPKITQVEQPVDLSRLLPRATLEKLKKKAQACAQDQLSIRKEEIVKAMSEIFQSESERARRLGDDSGAENLVEMKEILQKKVENSRLQLEQLRIIL